MRNVMKEAWKIAREGAKKFGGRAVDYFAEALRVAWAIVKKGVKKVSTAVRVELGIGSNKYKTWVAEIRGYDRRFKFHRNFIRENDAVGCEEYTLDTNRYYEVCDRGNRYFAKVVDGEVVEVKESEVIAYFA